MKINDGRIMLVITNSPITSVTLYAMACYHSGARRDGSK